MKQRTHTLQIDLDLTYTTKNPWKQRQKICDEVKKQLMLFLGSEVEVDVSCEQQQNGWREHE